MKSGGALFVDGMRVRATKEKCLKAKLNEDGSFNKCEFAVDGKSFGTVQIYKGALYVL